MSHLISGTLPLEGEPIMKMPLKEVVMPKINKMVKMRTSINEEQHHAEVKMMESYCSRLSELEYDQIHLQNQLQINRHISKLKKHSHRHSLFTESKAIDEIFTRDEDRTEEEKRLRKRKQHINTKAYLDQMPEKLHLEQKYHNKINMRINTLQESQEISQSKQNFTLWMNRNNNSPIKSPNFTKMTFLLEKLTDVGSNASKFERAEDHGQSPEKGKKAFKLKTLESQRENQIPSILNLKTPSRKQPKGIPNVTLVPLEQKMKYHKKKRGHHNPNRRSMMDLH